MLQISLVDDWTITSLVLKITHQQHDNLSDSLKVSDMSDSVWNQTH